MTRTYVGTCLALLLALPAGADAFEQTMTCDESGIYACEQGEVAKPVRWPNRCVHYYINEEGTADIPDQARLRAAVQQSFTAWNDVENGEFVMEYAGLTNEDRAEHLGDRDGGNANVIVWRDDEWPYASRTAFAITSVTFDPATGLIADADVEFNSQFHTFTVGDSGVNIDIANTLTHEAGHFFGLDHTSVIEATMYGSAPQGQTSKRSLDSDDIAGLLAAYPPVGVTPSCEEVPDYFEKPGKSKNTGCCATADSPAPTGAGALLALLAVFARRRRKS